MIERINSIINIFDVGDLKFFFLVAKKNIKNLIILSLIVSLLALFVSLNQEKKYLSKGIIVIESDDNNIVNIEEVYSVESRMNRINNQMAILKSDEVLEYIVKDKKNSMNFKNLYSQTKLNFFQRIFTREKKIDDIFLKKVLTDNFTVKNVPRSDVLELSFISINPRLSQIALQSIIESYQRYEIDTKIKITSYANQKITERLKDLVVQMDVAQKKLSNYKKENNLVDTGNVKQLKIKEIESISARIIDAKLSYQRQQNDLLSIKVAEGDVDALLAIDDLRSREEISNIKNTLNANESNMQSLLLIYTDKHPKIIQAKEQNDSLKTQLDKILDENIQQKAFQLSNINNFINLSEEELQKVTDELRILEEKESGMLKFSRELESSRKLYESFLQRVKETNEAQNLQVSKLKTIESPNLPSTHFYPTPQKNFILTFIISFMGIYGLLYFREMNSSVLKSPEAIDSLNIPQIGILPRVEKLKRGFHILQMFVEDGASSFSEAIRSSRAIIESKFEKNKSYMITSSNPSEGKTTYAFNLALSLEKSSKVLFIEADIRRPSVLNGFYQFDRQILGLGEIISGSANLNDTIFKVPGTELDIITSGEKRFDMSDIISKDQIKKFLDVLKLEYDYVIVDSPPVQPVSDTLILTQSSDYNLFVIRSEETRTASFMSSIKKIQNVGAKINGIIINDLDTSKDSYYSYYYSYTPDYYTKS
ncbi:polysaccharide biosynthesis tyrosine autokinase [Candidatus Pelagibacter bacterium]|nr:tyrosine-protein kinase family protein [Candidatus Pelagibacter bacterium]MDB2710126.1 polysaccharide biosynthesis tyrosine autokinase [Candidatus Pelagibacter bacterium]